MRNELLDAFAILVSFVGIFLFGAASVSQAEEVTPAVVVEMDPVPGTVSDAVVLGPFEKVKIEFEGHDFTMIVVAAPLGQTVAAEVARYLGEGLWTFTGAPEEYTSTNLIFRAGLYPLPASAARSRKKTSAGAGAGAR